MPKIGDFGVFRDDKGDESPCVVTRALDDGHVDLHLFHTNMRDIEVAMGGPRTVTIIGGPLPPDWGRDVTPRFVSRPAPVDFSDPRISPSPASVLKGDIIRIDGTGNVEKVDATPGFIAEVAKGVTVVADDEQSPIPVEASLAPKPEGE